MALENSLVIPHYTAVVSCEYMLGHIDVSQSASVLKSRIGNRLETVSFFCSLVIRLKFISNPV